MEGKKESLRGEGGGGVFGWWVGSPQIDKLESHSIGWL